MELPLERGRVVVKALPSPEVRERLAQAGFTPRGLPAERFVEQLRRELELVRGAGREARIVLDG